MITKLLDQKGQIGGLDTASVKAPHKPIARRRRGKRRAEYRTLFFFIKYHSKLVKNVLMWTYGEGPEQGLGPRAKPARSKGEAPPTYRKCFPTFLPSLTIKENVTYHIIFFHF